MIVTSCLPVYAKPEAKGTVETLEDGRLLVKGDITLYERPKEEKKSDEIDPEAYKKIKEAVLQYDQLAPKDDSELDIYVKEKIKNAKKLKTEYEASPSTEPGIRSLGFPYIKVATEWECNPYLYSSQLNTVGSDSWSCYNNYHSSVPIEVTEERENSIAYTIGFSGNVDMKVKLGLQASLTQTYKTKFTVGADVPAYVIWYQRPYVKYYSDGYLGKLRTYYIELFTGTIITQSEWVTGTNEREYIKGPQFASYLNPFPNIYSPAPNPPTYLP